MQYGSCPFFEKRVKDDKSFSKKNLQKLLTPHSSLLTETRSLPCFI
jgi:hypothetical protein